MEGDAAQCAQRFEIEFMEFPWSEGLFAVYRGTWLQSAQEALFPRYAWNQVTRTGRKLSCPPSRLLATSRIRDVP
ncbi:hypothetical protein ACFL5O_07575 [Myxococcota bacterium]